MVVEVRVDAGSTWAHAAKTLRHPRNGAIDARMRSLYREGTEKSGAGWFPAKLRQTAPLRDASSLVRMRLVKLLMPQACPEVVSQRPVHCGRVGMRFLLLVLACSACTSPTAAWRSDLLDARRESQRSCRDLAVYFALPTREQSDRMEQSCLSSPEALAALAHGEFVSVRLDGFQQQRLYGEWVGGGEGMGLCVLDPKGRPYAARPGPLDSPEVAAFLDACAAERMRIARLRSAQEAAPTDPVACLELGCALLELGCRVGAEPLLLQAAQGGQLDAHHRLARLFALDGHVVRARQWLRTALPSPAADVTLGYVLFKERQYRKAAETLALALQRGGLDGDELRARLYLGKAWIDCGETEKATAILEQLLRDAPSTTFGAAAQHSLSHLKDGNHGHSH